MKKLLILTDEEIKSLIQMVGDQIESNESTYAYWMYIENDTAELITKVVLNHIEKLKILQNKLIKYIE